MELAAPPHYGDDDSDFGTVASENSSRNVEGLT